MAGGDGELSDSLVDALSLVRFAVWEAERVEVDDEADRLAMVANVVVMGRGRSVGVDVAEYGSLEASVRTLRQNGRGCIPRCQGHCFWPR